MIHLVAMDGSQADRLVAKAKKLTTLSLTRWSVDWYGAAVLYEKAGNEYRYVGNYEKAKLAYEKASQMQERLSSHWDAAKDMECAALAAKELKSYEEAYELYKKAHALYIECDKHRPAVDAFVKGARILESFCNLDDVGASRFYAEAFRILEEDDDCSMAYDLYTVATNLFIRLNRFTEASTILLKWGLAADKTQAFHTQSKAYLSAIVVYLYAGNMEEATKCYGDCIQVGAFQKSDQGRTAMKLMSAYEEADTERIKAIAKSSSMLHLDAAVFRLAKMLPTHDMIPTNTGQEDEEDLT